MPCAEAAVLVLDLRRLSPAQVSPTVRDVSLWVAAAEERKRKAV